MSATAPISETAEQISALNISEELRAAISGTTWVVRREDERSYRLTRMDGHLIDAVVELSSVSAEETAAVMSTLSAEGLA